MNTKEFNLPADLEKARKAINEAGILMVISLVCSTLEFILLGYLTLTGN